MSEQPLPNIIQLTEQFQAALAAKDAATLQRLVNAYTDMYSRLKVNIENLAMKIELAGGEMTFGQIQRLTQYKELMTQIERQVTDYSGFLKTELSTAAKNSIATAGNDAKIMLAELLGGDARIVARIQSLDARVVENLLAYLSPEGELYNRLSNYGAEAAIRASSAIKDSVISWQAGLRATAASETIISSIGLGRGPRVLASELRKVLGMTLTDALRTARTVQLTSYRESTRANYIANSNVVKGWIWHAKLDGLTCASCVAQHGTRHELSDRLDDHYNGRCAMIPVTITNPNPDIQTGETWFNEQDEATQRKILGPGKYDALKAGKFEFSALSQQRPDAVYGTMRTAAPLKDLVPDGD